MDLKGKSGERRRKCSITEGEKGFQRQSINFKGERCGGGGHQRTSEKKAHL